MATDTVLIRKIIISKHFSRTTSNWHKTIVKAIGDGGEEGTESRCSQRIFAIYEKGQFVTTCSHFRYVLEKEEGLKRHPIFQHIFQHISHRNRLTIRLLQLIEAHRSQWLASNNPLHLAPWRAAELIATYNCRWQDVTLDASTLSRLINHTHVQVHGRRTLLKSLFPGRAQWIGAHIRVLLATNPLWVDRELQQQLGYTLWNRDFYPLSVDVQKTDGDTGKSRAEGKQYPASLLGEAIRFHAILEQIDNRPGVYEISQNTPNRYPCGESNIVYIGRSGQLRKRFLAYRVGSAHTSALKECFRQGKLYVRVAYTDQHIALEKKMVDTFEKQFGTLPRYNYNRP